MSERIIGYDANDKPIYEPKRGFIYTAALITCCKCKAVISGMGGPNHGSTCVSCHDQKDAK